MNIFSWNVAGIRARIKQNHLDFLINSNIDVICFQETKANPDQVIIPEKLNSEFPYKYWNSNLGTTQKLGFSGTSIWSKKQPIKQLETPGFDTEGRITTIEFDDFILVTVYTPNSQSLESPRLNYRTENWHNNFKHYISTLQQLKATIICGDFNVAHENIDVHHPEKHHKDAGFLDIERSQFQEYLDIGFIDIFRKLNPNEVAKYTYWSILNPKIRENNSGWRIDYFIVTEDTKVKDCQILNKIYGSDHCPITLEL